MSPKQIIMNNCKNMWLNDIQFQIFNVWKKYSISKELLDEYNEMSSVSRKRKIIDDLMEKLPNGVVMYQLKTDYHIFRSDNRRIRSLFVHIFSKDKRVTQVKKL